MIKEELQKILENHKHWLYEDVDGWENMKADLCGADLRGANLRNANLYNVDLCDADLCGADLCDADLCGADLRNANLCDVNLCDVNLCDAKYIPYIPMICPEEGEFIGWKKAGHLANKIVKLLITIDAKRSSSTTRKCRCSKAKVLEIYNLDGTIAEERKIESNRDRTFVYTVGETVEVSNFDDNRWKECSTGIHFFINRQEAINYTL